MHGINLEPVSGSLLKRVDKSADESWLWWKHGVIYHIYPRSFHDSNHDGIGDIQGIIHKLDYLSDLGVDGIWLSPVYSSPMFDFGYDISDYRQIDPMFGTLGDFRELLELAHRRNIHVIMDLVMNHTSNEHLWFRESMASVDNPLRDWYIWKDGNNGNPPNNWKTVFGGSAWEYDKGSGQYYMHTFFKQQPDLNWRNQDLKRTFFNGIRYWLDMGVDGFRVDVINLIGKDLHFRNNPMPLGIPLLQKMLYTSNRPESYHIARELRNLLNVYPERMCVAEVYSLPPGDSSVAATYLQSGDDAMNMTFDFSLMLKSWNARKYFRAIQKWYGLIPEKGWPCHVLSNHDLHRHFDRFRFRRNKEKKARISAMLMMTLRGTPFLYYGDEIGMRNAKLSKKEILDPLGKLFWPLFKGRDKGRSPMQWTPGIHAGFSKAKPWLRVNEDYTSINVQDQLDDEDSMFNFYRNLIRLRKKYDALSKGDWIPLVNGSGGLLVYLRNYKEESLMVILNFSGRKRKPGLYGMFASTAGAVSQQPLTPGENRREFTPEGFTRGRVLLSATRTIGTELIINSFTADPYEATLLEIFRPLQPNFVQHAV